MNFIYYFAAIHLYFTLSSQVLHNFNRFLSLILLCVIRKICIMNFQSIQRRLALFYLTVLVVKIILLLDAHLQCSVVLIISLSWRAESVRVHLYSPTKESIFLYHQSTNLLLQLSLCNNIFIIIYLL